MRRILIIIAVVIVALGIGVAGYFYFASRDAGISVSPGASPTLPTDPQNSVLSGQTNDNSSISSPVKISGRLMEISVGPIVPGLAVINTKSRNASSSSTGLGDVAVYYIERQSGNIFYYLTQAGGITRTSNRTVPGIESAAWHPNASVAYVRHLSGTDSRTINTYAMLSSGAGGFFLSQNLSDISVASTSVLTLTSGVNGSVASAERADGTNSSQIFTTPLSSLRVGFAGNTKYLVFTKPSATLSGDAFIVDRGGTFSRIAGPLNGLVALASPSGKWVLVSYVQNNEMQLALVNTATRETLSLPVATIADKCVWTADDAAIYCGIPVSPSKSYIYPDDWYQGATQFSDRIWKINVSGRYAQLVLDFKKETNTTLDTISLAIDPNQKTLAFINKINGSLWSYQL